MKHFKSSQAETSVASLRVLTTALPMAAEVHAAILRQRINSRRMVEDARDAARIRKDSLADLK